MTVDDTAPEVTALSKDLRTGNLTVTARDNQYIAVVQVLNSAGTEVLASSAMVETEAGGLGSVTLDLSQLDPYASKAVLCAGGGLRRQ